MHEPETSRWALVRDMLVFQAKLALDAIRDLFLSPVALICGLIDIIKGHCQSQSYFMKLMDFGHKTDSWLNLFGDRKYPSEKLEMAENNKPKNDVNVDHLFKKVESLLREQHGKGALTAAAKSKIDSYLNKIIENKKNK